MKKLLFTATLLLLLSLKPLFAGVAKGVDVREVQNILTELCFNPGPIDGVWGQKTEKAAEEFFTKYFKIYGGYFGHVQLKMLQASGRSGVAGGKELNQCPASISEKLKQGKTINVFKAWDSSSVDVYQKNYSLYWTVKPKGPRNTILLHQLNWNMNYTYTAWDDYQGIENFLTKRRWFHEDEYGSTVAVKFWDENYPEYLANLALSHLKRNQAEGIMLDWWRDEGNVLKSTGLSVGQVRKARTRIAKALRSKLKRDAIILGNVGWDFNTTTTEYINGVFLELYKVPGQKKYTYAEIKKMEKLLQFYDENLQEPRLIAMAPWRVSKLNNPKAISPSSSENIRYAKLFTAMSVVIPTNGYILYSDNNWDTTAHDYGNVYYDFYSFDIGKPTGGYEKLANGVGIKQHQKGFIAYNRNSRPHTLKLDNNVNLVIEGTSGLFCKKKSSGYDCLPPD